MPDALTVDRLPGPGAPLQVVQIARGTLGADGGGARPPHRHAYHELFWTRAGTGEHAIDGEPTPVRPSTVTLIGRGRVHVLERARDLDAAVVRFGDELLHDGPGAPVTPVWLLGGRGPRIVEVPPSDAAHLDAAIATLGAESRRPADGRSVHLQRHLLAVLLLWIERWYDATRTQRRGEDDADTQLHRRFSEILERDFARHHDAAHYADALGVPPPALARALVRATGRGTKEHVTDRVMLEAARMLRFTDATDGEIAFRAGFADPLYFSRAFKRHHGASPVAYRAQARGGEA